MTFHDVLFAIFVEGYVFFYVVNPRLHIQVTYPGGSCWIIPNRCNTQWQSPIGNGLFLGLPHHISCIILSYRSYMTGLFEVVWGVSRVSHEVKATEAQKLDLTCQNASCHAPRMGNGTCFTLQIGVLKQQKEEAEQTWWTLKTAKTVGGSDHWECRRRKLLCSSLQKQTKNWCGVLDFRAQISLRGLLKSRTASTLTSKWNLYNKLYIANVRRDHDQNDLRWSSSITSKII